MALAEIICPICTMPKMVERGAINRAARRSSPIFCGRKCAGISRRCGKTKKQIACEKAEYDREYRHINRNKIKDKKALYFQKTYDPAIAAIYRKKRMHMHVAYCQKPEYKIKKAKYDKCRRATARYGEYAQCFIVSQEIRDECLSRQTDYEIRLEKGTLSKSTKRKRDYERLNSTKFERIPLGNAGSIARRH